MVKSGVAEQTCTKALDDLLVKSGEAEQTCTKALDDLLDGRQAAAPSLNYFVNAWSN